MDCGVVVGSGVVGSAVVSSGVVSAAVGGDAPQTEHSTCRSNCVGCTTELAIFELNRKFPNLKQTQPQKPPPNNESVIFISEKLKDKQHRV